MLGQVHALLGPKGARAVVAGTRLVVLLLVLAIGVAGCRGEPSTSPPIRMVQDMWYQPSVRPQMALGTAAAATPAPVPEGVVPEGTHLVDEGYASGLSAGQAVEKLPLPMTSELLANGEALYGAFCSSCHDRAGSGRGSIPARGFPVPVDLASANTRGLSDGGVFRVMGAGIRNMPPMGSYVSVEERWSIVAWVRVLQRSQHATVADVEPGLVARILPEAKRP